MGDLVSAIGQEGHSKGGFVQRRAFLTGAALTSVGFASKAHALASDSSDWQMLKALPSFCQTGPTYDRVLKVISRIWRTQSLAIEELELGLVETGAVRAEITKPGQVWLTTGFVSLLATDGQIAAWFCQNLCARQTERTGLSLDRTSLAALVTAGYDPRVSNQLWTRWATLKNLRNSSRFKDVPTSKRRLEALRQEIEKLGYLL